MLWKHQAEYVALCVHFWPDLVPLNGPATMIIHTLYLDVQTQVTDGIKGFALFDCLSSIVMLFGFHYCRLKYFDMVRQTHIVCRKGTASLDSRRNMRRWKNMM